MSILPLIFLLVVLLLIPNNNIIIENLVSNEYSYLFLSSVLFLKLFQMSIIYSIDELTDGKMLKEYNPKYEKSIILNPYIISTRTLMLLYSILFLLHLINNSLSFYISLFILAFIYFFADFLKHLISAITSILSINRKNTFNTIISPILAILLGISTLLYYLLN